MLQVINAITGKHSVSTTKYHFYKNMTDYKDYILSSISVQIVLS